MRCSFLFVGLVLVFATGCSEPKATETTEKKTEVIHQLTQSQLDGLLAAVRQEATVSFEKAKNDLLRDVAQREAVATAAAKDLFAKAEAARDAQSKLDEKFRGLKSELDEKLGTTVNNFFKSSEVPGTTWEVFWDAKEKFEKQRNKFHKERDEFEKYRGAYKTIVELIREQQKLRMGSANRPAGWDEKAKYQRLEKRIDEIVSTLPP